MKVENIPAHLTYIFPAADGGREYLTSDQGFDTDFPAGEDRTADSIMMDAYLSMTIQN